MTVASKEPGSRFRAALVVVLLPGLLFYGLYRFLDHPLPRVEVAGKSTRAALAIRDHVHPGETVLTWAFVKPRLEAAYAEVATVTALCPIDGRVREAAVAAFLDLAERYPSVDVYCLAHRNNYVSFFETLPDALTEKLRFVYNSGCRNGRQADRWLSVGADVYVAHPGAASHAYFFFLFFRRWTTGVDLRTAVREGNRGARAFFDRMTVLGDAWVEAKTAYARSPALIHGEPDLSLEGPLSKGVPSEDMPAEDGS